MSKFGFLRFRKFQSYFPLEKKQLVDDGLSEIIDGTGVSTFDGFTGLFLVEQKNQKFDQKMRFELQTV